MQRRSLLQWRRNWESHLLRVAAGRGIALGRIVEVSVEGMELGRNIYLAHHRRQRLTRAQAKFWEYVNSSKSEFSAVVG
ncbi:MAG: hypothetical protein ACXW4E_03550 [Anaerolineales bacterium]